VTTIHCDMVERSALPDGPTTKLLMPLISCGNVARVGFHTHPTSTICARRRLANQHMSRSALIRRFLPDLQGFGRREMKCRGD